MFGFKDSFQKSCLNKPQQNGMVECTHKHLLEITQAFLLDTKLHAQFWVDRVYITTFIIN